VGRLVEESQGEWRGLILLAATTGLRLGDAVGIKWANFQEDFIKLEDIKTHGEVFIPIHTDFANYLKNEQQGIGDAPVFPTLSKKQISHLSRDFRKLMELSKVTGKVAEAKGDAGRKRYSKSFHCFRHYFISTLANAGVSQEVRQKLVAHSDDAVHKFYTHLERDTFRNAVQKVPSLIEAKPASKKTNQPRKASNAKK
jgi:integrase